HSSLFRSSPLYRPLSSFPTRRSSDLDLARGRCRAGLAQFAAFAHPGLQAAVEEVAAAVADHVEQPDEAAGPAAPFIVVDHVNGIDRKSTRLNSSHVKISYAVFCLKKK